MNKTKLSLSVTKKEIAEMKKWAEREIKEWQKFIKLLNKVI